MVFEYDARWKSRLLAGVGEFQRRSIILFRRALRGEKKGRGAIDDGHA